MEENTRLKKLVAYQNVYPDDSSLPKNSGTYHFDYIPAKIVNNTINKSINYITINKGSKDGFKKD
jgi:rod shape-determining protein MreC